MTDRTAPLVTAIVAVFREEFEYLAISIESALAQTFPVHVLVTDTGNSNAIREFAAKYGDRVSYCAHATPVGVAANHRGAIAGLHTPYFAILNYDDAWESTFLEALVPELEAHPECVLAFSDHSFIDTNGRLLADLTDRMTVRWGRDRLREGVQTERASLLAAGTVPLAMSTVVRTAEAQRHPIPDAAGPAYDLWLHYSLATEGRPYWYSPKRLTRYRVHENAGTAMGNPDWYRGTAFCWDTVRADSRFATIRPTANRLAARAWWSVAKALLKQHAPRAQVKEAAANSVRAEPTLKARTALRFPGALRLLLVAYGWLRR